MCRELSERLHKPSLKMKGLRWIRVGSAEWEVQLTHFGAFCPALLQVWSVDVCATCWWEILNACSLCMRDLPHTYSCTCFYSNKKKTKVEINMGSTDLTSRSLNHFIKTSVFVIICFIFIFLCNTFVLFYFIQFAHPTF
jgi:hypothetical protein